MKYNELIDLLQDDKYLEERIKEKEKEALINNETDFIGINAPLNNPGYIENNLLESCNEWIGYIPSNVKLIYGVLVNEKDEVLENGGHYYYLDDITYIKDFIKYASNIDICDEFTLIEEVRIFLDNYFTNLEQKDYHIREELFTPIVINDRNMERHISNKIFYKKNAAVCSEYASFLENILSLFGVDTSFIIGKVKYDGEVESHAYNIVQIDNEKYIVDIAIPIIITDLDAYVTDYTFYPIKITSEEYEDLLNDKTIKRKEHFAVDFGNELIFYNEEDVTREYGLGQCKVKYVEETGENILDLELSDTYKNIEDDILEEETPNYILNYIKDNDNLDKFIEKRIEDLSNESKYYNKNDKVLGLDIPDDFKNIKDDTINNVPYWDGFIPNNIKIIISSDRKENKIRNNGQYYYIDDNNYLKDFIKYIKTNNLEFTDIVEAVYYVTDFLNSYLYSITKVNTPNIKEEYERAEYLDVIRDKNDNIMSLIKHSNSIFYSNNIALCSEYSTFTNNILNFLGYNSLVVFGTEILMDSTSMGHAYNIVEDNDKYYLVDTSDACINYRVEDNIEEYLPFIEETSPKEIEELLDNNKELELDDYETYQIGNNLYEEYNGRVRTYSTKPKIKYILKEKIKIKNR